MKGKGKGRGKEGKGKRRGKRKRKQACILSPVHGLGVFQKEFSVLPVRSHGGSGYMLTHAAELVSLLSKWRIIFSTLVLGVHRKSAHLF